jgi:hypothetical protein
MRGRHLPLDFDGLVGPRILLQIFRRYFTTPLLECRRWLMLVLYILSRVSAPGAVVPAFLKGDRLSALPFFSSSGWIPGWSWIYPVTNDW